MHVEGGRNRELYIEGDGAGDYAAQRVDAFMMETGRSRRSELTKCLKLGGQDWDREK
jgi:hypothetical protein